MEKKLLISGILNIFLFLVICVLIGIISIMWNNLSPDTKRDKWTYKKNAWVENGQTYAVGEVTCHTGNIHCSCKDKPSCYDQATENALKKIQKFTGKYPSGYSYEKVQTIEILKNCSKTEIGEICEVEFHVYILLRTM